MIFVTIGSMLPFDRLIRAMDAWAAERPQETMFCQIGDGAYEPTHGTFARMVPPAEYRDVMKRAEVIVAHAGMGSVISAAEIAKPIVLLPRRAELREHTTEHQRHTARWLKDREGIFIADDEGDLPAAIEAARSSRKVEGALSPFASADFTDRLGEVIRGRVRLRGQRAAGAAAGR